MSETTVETPENTEVEQQEAVEVDWKAEARKHEKAAKELRAQLRDAKPQLDELQILKAASQTEAERTAAALTDAQKRAEQAERDALRFRVAVAKGLEEEDLEFISGDDEASILASAEKFLARAGTRQQPRNLRPDGSQGSSSKGTAAMSEGEQFAAFLKQQMGRQ